MARRLAESSVSCHRSQQLVPRPGPVPHGRQRQQPGLRRLAVRPVVVERDAGRLLGARDDLGPFVHQQAADGPGPVERLGEVGGVEQPVAVDRIAVRNLQRQPWLARPVRAAGAASARPAARAPKASPSRTTFSQWCILSRTRATPCSQSSTGKSRPTAVRQVARQGARGAVLPGVRQLVGSHGRQRDLRHQLEVVAEQRSSPPPAGACTLSAAAGGVVLGEQRVDAVDPLRDVVLQARYRIGQLGAEAGDLRVVPRRNRAGRSRNRPAAAPPWRRIRSWPASARGMSTSSCRASRLLDERRHACASSARRYALEFAGQRRGQRGADEDLGRLQQREPLLLGRRGRQSYRTRRSARRIAASRSSQLFTRSASSSASARCKRPRATRRRSRSRSAAADTRRSAPRWPRTAPARRRS